MLRKFLTCLLAPLLLANPGTVLAHTHGGGTAGHDANPHFHTGGESHAPGSATQRGPAETASHGHGGDDLHRGVFHGHEPELQGAPWRGAHAVDRDRHVAGCPLTGSPDAWVALAAHASAAAPAAAHDNDAIYVAVADASRIRTRSDASAFEAASNVCPLVGPFCEGCAERRFSASKVAELGSAPRATVPFYLRAGRLLL